MMINVANLDKIAIVRENSNITYKNLIANSQIYAQLYANISDSRICIFSENREEWIFAFYSAWFNNCTVVPIDHLASDEDVEYIINDAQPEVIFTCGTLLERVNSIKSKNEYNFKIFNFEEIDLNQTSNNNFHKELVIKDTSETAVIIYTSGTTGYPKGVMLSYDNLIANVRAVSKDVKIFTPDRKVLLLLPLHHIFPLAGSMLAPLYVGGTVVISPSMQSNVIIETLQKNGVNILIGVPRFYELLYKGIKSKINKKFIAKILLKLFMKYKSPTLAKKVFKQIHKGFGGEIEIMVSGGAALNKEVGTFFQNIGFEILEGYGMTEAAPMITFSRPGRSVIGSPGEPLPGLEVKVVDDEITAKGPNIMKGYYNKPLETEAVIKDGWLYTGDLGYFDQQGYLYITGRSKEIIVLSNGKNINPNEIEEKLNSFEYVKESGVIYRNDVLHAIIVPEFDKFNSKNIIEIENYFKNEIIPQLNSNLSSYKRLTSFTIVSDELPRTRLSKLQRYKLIDLIQQNTKDKSQNKETTEFGYEFKIIKEFLESQIDKEIKLSDNLIFDLNVDSLLKIGLLYHIEQLFGLTISESDIEQFRNIEDLCSYINQNKKKNTSDFINWTSSLKEKVTDKIHRTWPTLLIFAKSMKATFILYFTIKAQGHKNLPAGPCIIAPNHQSYLDGFILTSLLKSKTVKDTYFYAKRKHIKNAFVRFIAKKNNIIFMEHDSDLKQSIQRIANVLQQGKKLIIFPEGTRSQTGYLGDFKRTFAILSKELNIPVIPVAIDGTYAAMPSGTHFPKPFTKININFLPPVFPEEHSYDSLKEYVKDIISKHLVSK